MKTFLILALLAVAATMATANVQFEPSGQYQTQQPFPLQQQPFAQPQPFSHEQQQFPEQQQPFLQQQQQPFQQQQQQHVQFGPSGQYQSEQPFPQVQQPFAQPQPFSQEQQPFLQHQQPFFQPFLEQQLNPCRQFLVQKCSPVGIVSFLRLRIFHQTNCLVMQNQCCRQLVQIPEQLRCPAIHNIVDAVIMQHQQQQQQQQWFLHPLRKLMGRGFFQPQQQQVGQGFIQPQHLGQFEAMRNFALQTLPAMCNVQVPLYCRGAV